MMIVPDRIAPRFPELVPVLEEVEAFRVPTWLVAHRELRTIRWIRLVFDHLAESLS